MKEPYTKSSHADNQRKAKSHRQSLLYSNYFQKIKSKDFIIKRFINLPLASNGLIFRLNCKLQIFCISAQYSTQQCCDSNGHNCIVQILENKSKLLQYLFFAICYFLKLRTLFDSYELLNFQVVKGKGRIDNFANKRTREKNKNKVVSLKYKLVHFLESYFLSSINRYTLKRVYSALLNQYQLIIIIDAMIRHHQR